jgi:uncharacterized protein
MRGRLCIQQAPFQVAARRHGFGGARERRLRERRLQPARSMTSRRDILRYASASFAFAGCHRESAQGASGGPLNISAAPGTAAATGSPIPRRPLGQTGAKVCSHGRGADVAMAQLEESLRRLQTDHLDLWQVHECVYDNDPERHYAVGGVLDALAQAKRQGKVRFVGFTGHKDPRIHLEMLERGYPFDTAQMPLNAFDAGFRSFEQRVVPELRRRGMGVIGMKSLGGQGKPVTAGVVSPDEAIRYAMSIPGVSVTVSGIDSMAVLAQNLAVAQGFVPMSDMERQALRARLASAAADGHFELYKTTTYFDGKVGREQHGYPPHESLPL